MPNEWVCAGCGEPWEVFVRPEVIRAMCKRCRNPFKTRSKDGPAIRQRYADLQKQKVVEGPHQPVTDAEVAELFPEGPAPEYRIPWGKNP